MEKIICSAIWYKDLEIRKDIPSYARNPKNIEEGVVFCGLRHGNCLFTMAALTGLRQCEAGREVQGFLTNKGRFVDRYEAAKIAIASKQVEKLYSDELYSEDLY